MNRKTVVGVVANPAAARDVRRLVAQGAAVTAHDKRNIVRRVMTGLGRTGVERALLMADRAGITGRLIEESAQSSAAGWPALELLDQDITGSALDTTTATRRMVELGVDAIVVLGGDGTCRLVATDCGDVPLVAISTGTNNAFPKFVEPTVAGMAAGFIATHRLDVDVVAKRAKMLQVDCHALPHSELALVDVAILNTDRVGAGAIWEPGTIEELFLAFAPADGIGLSAIGGHLLPIDRHEPIGLTIRLASTVGATGPVPPTQRVTAPIGPGLFAEVGVASWSKLAVGQTITAATSSGTVAVDGERMFRFESEVSVTLRTDGPRVVDVTEAMETAARAGLLTRPRGKGT